MTHQKPEEYFRDAPPRKGILQQIARDASKMQAYGERGPVLLCFVTDPYQSKEREYRVTRQTIEILHFHNIRVTILTKAGALARRDFDLLGPEDTFATTLTCVGDEASRKWEPNASLPSDRIANLMEAHRRGFKTWVSFEPVIEPEWTLALIDSVAGFVDLIKVGTMNYHEHGKDIDWKAFGFKAKALLDKRGKPYYLKKDLCQEMGIPAMTPPKP